MGGCAILGIEIMDVDTRRLEVVHEQEEFLAVNKPAGLLVHPTKPGCGWTMWDGLRELLAYELSGDGQISIINRLDRETSGLVLIAKSSAASRSLGMAMLNRQFQKHYLAWVQGWPEQHTFSHSGAIRQRPPVPSPFVWLKREVHPAGDEAATHFEVLERTVVDFAGAGRKVALVHARPVTGRTHQIRVHLSDLGHPVVGDKIYGGSELHYLEFVETGWTPALAQKVWVENHLLHAHRMTFDWFGKQIELIAPPPLSMRLGNF